MIETAIIQPHPGIGDMVWHVPALRALAATIPGGRFALLTRASVQAERLFRAEPMVAAVHDVPSVRGVWRAAAGLAQLVATLRRGRFRRVYVLHRGTRFGLAAAIAGVPERIGYTVAGRGRWLTRPVAVGPITAGVDIIDALDRFLPALGLTDDRAPPTIAVPDDAAAEVGARFDACPRPWVVLAIGAAGDDRRWPVARFAGLAARLPALGVGTVFVLGNDRERAMVDMVVAAAPQAAVPVTGMAVDRVLALIDAADLFVGNDSGPMNLAAACGRPALGLVGSPGSRIPFDRLPTLSPVTPPGGPNREGMTALSIERVAAHVDACLRTATATA